MSPAPSQVTATLTHPLRGTDMVEAVSVLRGELGSPHLSVLPVLDERGPRAQEPARTCAVLDSLYVDRQPHGWRLGPTPGDDSRAASALLRSDVNVLADVIGAESGADRGPVAVSLVGPVTLAASVELRNGEKLLSDHGARRDLVQSWCAGVTRFLRTLRRDIGGRDAVVHVVETQLRRVLEGTVPTASGYRTLRAVARQEVLAALTDAVAACREAGSGEIAVSPGRAPAQWARDAGADAVVLPTPTGPVAEWEPLAALTEAGVRLWFETVPVTGPARPGELARGLARPWRELGMPAAALAGVRLAPVPAVTGVPPGELAAVLRRCTDTAAALTEGLGEA